MNKRVSGLVLPFSKSTTIELNSGIDPSWQLQQLRDGSDGKSFVSVLVSTDGDLIRASSSTCMHEIFDATCESLGSRAKRQVALDYGDVSYSYADLRNRSNQLARFLSASGIGPGATVALLLERTIDLYAMILALSKVGAAFVPLDAAFPEDRICFILNDSECDLLVTLTDLVNDFNDSPESTIKLDEHYTHITQLSSEPFIESNESQSISHLSSGIHATDKPQTDISDSDPLAYIIYTSGSTGRPKGVPVRQSAICNFLEVAKQCYGYLPADRVYQCLTIAFDFSFEEIWVPLAVGATLVPAPPGAKLAGDDLYEFLSGNRVTALCVVPTLLATLKPDLPLVRFLLVSGEACPADLIEPWLCDERRIINAYGPTETTVTATWSVMQPGQEVTIGGPLPTYSIVIIDPDSDEPIQPGESGEICVAGVGLASGYHKRPDQTARAFIEDVLGMPDNPGGKIYRTGDLGRFTESHQIEYLGRIDTQVKIRGYRIELGEIEALIRSMPGVENAVVKPFCPDGDGAVLAAYLVPSDVESPTVTASSEVAEVGLGAGGTSNSGALDINAIVEFLRSELPGYMVPLYFEQLDALPVLASDKVDRSALPDPVSVRFSKSAAVFVKPRTEIETKLAQLLADTLKVEQVSVEADFFDELGADSLTLASYVAGIRKHLGIKRISMRQLYENTTIAQVAELLEKNQASKGAAKSATSDPAAKTIEPQVEKVSVVTGPSRAVADTAATERTTSLPTNRDASHREKHIPSILACVLTAIAQVLVYAVSVFLTILAGLVCYQWANSAETAIELTFRSVISANLLFFGTAASLIALKWMAVGRFSSAPIPIYSLAYLRFWTARQAIRSNPFNLFTGTPLYSTYLRLLGMSVGKNSVLLSVPPICTDLVTIGANTIIRQDCLFPGYTAANGYLYPGTVSIGADVLICEATVLDINTSIGDGAQLGTTSGLLQGQSIPAGAVWQGSPAQPCTANFNKVNPHPLSLPRKLLFTLFHLMSLCLFSLPLSMIVGLVLLQSGFSLADQSIGLAAAAVLFFTLALTAIIVLLVPRFFSRFIVPEVSHPVYGAQYELARAVNRVSNNRMLNTIFGDSSMIVHWLSLVGYDLSKTTQTGSNFGVDQRHHSPFLCSFDRNTLVSDGLLMMNMETTSNAFVLKKISMPPDTYVGNVVHYPADSRLGENCLIATKAAIPIDGGVRSNVGILGSPSFEIPRSVARDQKFDYYKMPGIFEKRLRMKLKSNLVTLGLYLLRLWVLLVVGLAITSMMLSVSGTDNVLKAGAGLTVASLATFLFSALFSILCERVVCGFRRLKPRYCSLYDPLFWAHERFWKLNYNAFITVFNGTPMKPFFLRLQGAKIGSCVFDDGAGLTEPSMTEIGDNCMLNLGSSLQCHSLEDGTFKSDLIKLGSDCTVGVGGFVHYGAKMMDGSTLKADSFLMKGSVIETQSCWHGNPARDEFNTSANFSLTFGE